MISLRHQLQLLLWFFRSAHSSTFIGSGRFVAPMALRPFVQVQSLGEPPYLSMDLRQSILRLPYNKLRHINHDRLHCLSVQCIFKAFRDKESSDGKGSRPWAWRDVALRSRHVLSRDNVSPTTFRDTFWPIGRILEHGITSDRTLLLRFCGKNVVN